jgi:archaellum component FlaC
MTQNDLKELIADLRMNHEYCEKETILQAANELERLRNNIETLSALYEQVRKQCDQLMMVQSSMVEAFRGFQGKNQ